MSAEPAPKETGQHRDEELDELLDSALGDFERKKKPAAKKDAGNVAAAAAAKHPKKKIGELPPSADEELARIFSSAGLAHTGPELQDLREELAKLAGRYEQQQQQEGCGVDNVLKETLKELSEGSSQLADQPSEEELHKMFESLGLGPPGREGVSNQDIGNLLPMMEGMMQSLLSKDLLYPAMKDIADKYPDWLADNRANLTTADFEKYNKQCELTRKVCFLFEEEQETDGEEAKKKRFERVMALMQEMQSLGHPPKELIGEAPPDGIQFDAQGNPILPGTEQCVIS